MISYTFSIEKFKGKDETNKQFICVAHKCFFNQ